MNQKFPATLHKYNTWLPENHYPAFTNADYPAGFGANTRGDFVSGNRWRERLKSVL